jgi:lysophospholipase L1-like esterase
MSPSMAEALASDPIYRRQNEMLASLCQDLKLNLADTTDALIHAEEVGGPQYWEFDTHPRPAGYATIAKRIFDAWQQLPGAH